MLRVDNLKKYFPVRGSLPFSGVHEWVHAVDGISFTVGVGETLALVGESGCGKTTTSRLILLLEEPTSGAVYFQGRDAHRLKGEELKSYRSSVQAVFQNPWSSLDPRMRVNDIIAEPMAINTRMSRREQSERVSYILAEVGLSPTAGNRWPHEFSGGQRQRIAVARALALASRFIVLDEPVSALDVSIRAQIMNLLKDLQAKYTMSYLLISHNLATVRYLSHHVAVMYLGQIVETAASEDLFRIALHPYTRALISASIALEQMDQHERIILPGEVPSSAKPPSGCRFHPRCPLRNRLGRPLRCEEDEPVLRELLPGHFVACHFAEEIAAEAGATEESAATDSPPAAGVPSLAPRGEIPGGP